MSDDHMLHLSQPASCADPQFDPEWWHPVEVGGSTAWSYTFDAKRARSVCQSCPVKQECLDYALQYFELAGIWGGLDRKERHAIQVAKNMNPTSWVNSYASGVYSVPHNRENNG
jgi:WhiB family redox-sensing transcriptional regulator